MAISLFEDMEPVLNVDKYSQKDAEDSYYAYMETKDIKYAIEFAERIQSAFVNMVNIILEDARFLTLVLPDGKTVLDKMKENNVNFSIKGYESAARNIDLIKLLVDNGYTAVVGHIEEETLFKTIDENQTVFDYLIGRGLLTRNIIRNITSNHLEVIPKVIEYDKLLLTSFNEDILFSASYEGKRLIEYVIDEKLLDFVNIKYILHHAEIVDLLIEHNREDLLWFLSEEILAQKKENSTVLDYLLKRGIKPHCLYTRIDTIKALLDNNEIDSLMKLNEEALIKEIEPGKTVLEELLERGITPRVDKYKNNISLEILSKLKRYDLMCCVDTRLLLSLRTINETYLEQLISNINYKKDNSLIKLSRFGLTNDERAKFLITMAKYDLISYIEEVTTQELLLKTDGKCLLDVLLDRDIDLTINRIIPEGLDDIDVALHLRLHGIEQEQFRVNISSNNYLQSYYYDYNERFSHLSMDEESRALLDELYNTMRFGGRCDIEALELMRTSYEFMLHTNNSVAKEEIRRVIELKKGDPTFCVVADDRVGSHYDELHNKVSISDRSIGVFNHELMHALFSNYTLKEIPRDFTRILFQLRNDKDFIRRVNEYCEKYREIITSVEDLVEEKYMKQYDRWEREKTTEVQAYLSEIKDRKRREYLQEGYSEETLDTILNRTFTAEEVVAQDRRIRKFNLVDAVLKTEYAAFSAIGDMLDAIVGGTLRSGQLLNEESKIIPHGCGHGIAYYSREAENIFNETLANFALIFKSPEARETLNYLKGLVGEEYINLLFNYYRSEILLSQKYAQKEDQNKEALA